MAFLPAAAVFFFFLGRQGAARAYTRVDCGGPTPPVASPTRPLLLRLALSGWFTSGAFTLGSRSCPYLTLRIFRHTSGSFTNISSLTLPLHSLALAAAEDRFPQKNYLPWMSSKKFEKKNEKKKKNWMGKN